MSRDPKTEPMFGDVFVWRDGMVEFDVLYLKPDGSDGEFMGIELDTSALAAHMPNLFAPIACREWAFVEHIGEGHATGGTLTGSWAAEAWLTKLGLSYKELIEMPASVFVKITAGES